MKASIKWLERLTGRSLDPVDVSRRLTFAGLEVEGSQTVGRGLETVRVAEVLSVERHPHKDKLNLVTINLSTERRIVVCGAPNVPAAGGRVSRAGDPPVPRQHAGKRFR